MSRKTKLIGLSARKGGGKSSLAKLLINNGHIFFGDGSPPDSIRPDGDGRGVTYLLASGRTLRVRAYAMADPLKRFCVDVLGLEERQVYGSEADKQTLTRYKFEELPHYPRILQSLREQVQQEVDKERAEAPYWERALGDLVGGWKNMVENRIALRAPTGPMSARQLLQAFGTEVVRAMWADAWNQACLKAIERDTPDVAIVDDCRFEDELEALTNAGGITVRLQRNPSPEDSHKSETALDLYDGYDFVLPDGLTLHETCRTFLSDLARYGIIRSDWDAGHVLWPPYPNVSAVVDLAVKHCKNANWDAVGAALDKLERRYMGVDVAEPGGDYTGYAVVESSP